MSACVIWTLALGAAWRSMGTTTPKTMATATMAMATSSIVDTTLLMAFLRVFLLVRDSLYVCIPVQSGCTTPLKVGFAVLVLVLVLVLGLGFGLGLGLAVGLAGWTGGWVCLLLHALLAVFV